MRIFSLIAMAASALMSLALNPLDHTTLLNDHDRAARKNATVAIDEEDPYFLLMEEADSALANGRYLEAVERLKDAMRVNPEHPTNALLLSNLGIAYNYLNYDSLALDAFDRALLLAPSMTTVHSNRAMLLLKMNRDMEARQGFAHVIARDSLNSSARYYHGMLSLYAHDLRGAEADFAVLASVAPDDYNTQVAMSALYSLTGQDARAIPYYKKLIEMDPAAEYYAALAGCYLATSDLQAASETLANGFKTCGEDAELYYYRAWLRRDSYMMDEARSDAKRAIELGASPAKVNALFKK